MLRNYLKTALRNLARNRFFTILNIFGLALGMSICLVIIAVVTFLFRYDDFHTSREQIFRITTNIKDNQSNPSFATAPVGLANVLKEDVPGVDKVVRISYSLREDVSYHEMEIPVDGFFSDPEFLTVFNFPLLKGNANEALSKPNSIVISEETASKIFGDKDPLGELINIAPYGELVVTGVLNNVPANSHMRFDVVASYSTLLSHNSSIIDDQDNLSDFHSSYIYMLLEKDKNASTIESVLDGIAKSKYDKPGVAASFQLQNLDDIILGPVLYDNIGPAWHALPVIIGCLMTLVILIPACANYVHLSISQSLKRMREIGIRKAMGGQRYQIFFQFVAETVITMMFAVVLAYFFFEIIRGEALIALAEANTMDLTPGWTTFVGFIAFALLVGLIAGVVPAIYFSKMQPVKALKGKFVQSRGGFPVRKIVLTAQFVLSLVFIMVVTIMMRQYRHSLDYELGFDQSNILDIDLQNVDHSLLRNELGKLSAVQSVGMSSHIIGLESRNEYVKTPATNDSLETHSIAIDENFISTMELELLYGRGFSGTDSENERVIVVNEQFAKALSITSPMNALNQPVVIRDGEEVRIVGILKNFNYASLRDSIGSFFFEYDPSQLRHANVKLQGGDRSEQNASIEMAWKNIGGESKLSAKMLSDEIAEAYAFYFEVVKMWGFLGILAIAVACMGLLGTVVFTIKGRIKEISLRKVMGASSQSLVFLLSRDFVFLMIIASLITVPSVYAIVDQMLVRMQYYRLDIGFFEIALSLFIMIALGLSTILSQTMRAANSNPAENLKVE